MNSNAAQLSDLGIYIGRILSALFPILGTVVFIAILIGGFKILVAGGDAKAVSSGKSMIFGAITSIVLGISVWLILNLIYTLTGAPIINFNIMFQ